MTKQFIYDIVNDNRGNDGSGSYSLVNGREVSTTYEELVQSVSSLKLEVERLEKVRENLHSSIRELRKESEDAIKDADRFLSSEELVAAWDEIQKIKSRLSSIDHAGYGIGASDIWKEYEQLNKRDKKVKRAILAFFDKKAAKLLYERRKLDSTAQKKGEQVC